MALNIEDYGLIGDCHTAALVGTDGSMDWLCMPRFDSPSMFGALLGDEDHGRWLLAPAGPVLSTSREYLEDTFILVTTWRTESGVVEVTDFMPTDNLEPISCAGSRESRDRSSSTRSFGSASTTRPRCPGCARRPKRAATR